MIITPFILSAFLFFMQSLAVDSGNKVIPDPSTSPLPSYPQCGWEDCVSLQVSYVTNNASKTIADYPWIDGVLSLFHNKTGVNYEKRETPITSFPTLQNYYGEMESNPNRTQMGILMCGDTS